MKTTGILAPHIRFIPFGALISTGPDVTATEAVAPDNDQALASDSQLWQEIGEIEVSSDNPVTGTPIPILDRVPFSAQMKVKKKVRLGPVSREITFTCLSQNNVTVQLAALAEAINDASTTAGQWTEYVPFANGANGVAGWFQISYLDEVDDVVRKELHRGDLTLAQPVAGNVTQQFKPSFMLTLYPDAANTSKRSLLLKKTS